MNFEALSIAVLWMAIAANAISMYTNHLQRKRYLRASAELRAYHEELQRIVAIRMSEGKVIPLNPKERL